MYKVISLVNMNDEIGIRVFPDKPIIEGEQINYLSSEGDVELMQFTGLLDKNGKEIYEGDIIHFGDDKILQTVEYRKGQYMAKQIGTFGSYIGLGYCDWEKESEIIGNIHENPEILN